MKKILTPNDDVAGPPKVVPHSFGFRDDIDLDRMNQLADELEAEAFVASLQKQIEGTPGPSHH